MFRIWFSKNADNLRVMLYIYLLGEEDCSLKKLWNKAQQFHNQINHYIILSKFNMKCFFFLSLLEVPIHNKYMARIITGFILKVFYTYWPKWEEEISKRKNQYHCCYSLTIPNTRLWSNPRCCFFLYIFSIIRFIPSKTPRLAPCKISSLTCN